MNINPSAVASAAAEPTEERPQFDTILLKDLKSERRRGVRYLCQVKTLYNASGQKSDLYDETWNVGRIIDISVSGIALLLKQRMPLGAVISLAPMISSWNGDCLRWKFQALWRSGCARSLKGLQSEISWVKYEVQPEPAVPGLSRKRWRAGGRPQSSRASGT